MPRALLEAETGAPSITERGSSRRDEPLCDKVLGEKQGMALRRLRSGWRICGRAQKRLRLRFPRRIVTPTHAATLKELTDQAATCSKHLSCNHALEEFNY